MTDPSSPRPPRKLTDDQRATYDENGYVVVPDVFSGDELTALDEEVDRIEARLSEERRSRNEQRGGPQLPAGVLLQLGVRSEVCQQVAQDERVLTLIEDIVRPGIAVHSVKLITKPSFTDIPCHWHQDDAYYLKGGSRSRTRMSVWVPLQDSHERNGCLWVVPGSHRWGLQPHHKKDYGQCRLAMDGSDIEAVLREQAIPVPVPGGVAVLFSAGLWHGSKGNETSTRRRAFITSYQEATAIHQEGDAQAYADEWRIVRPPEAAAISG